MVIIHFCTFCVYVMDIIFFEALVCFGATLSSLMGAVGSASLQSGMPENWIDPFGFESEPLLISWPTFVSGWKISFFRNSFVV